MEEFGALAFLGLVLGAGMFVGDVLGNRDTVKGIKESCDRYGAAYIKDVRYSCKPEPATQAERDQGGK